MLIPLLALLGQALAGQALVGPTVLALTLAGPIVVGPITVAPRAVLASAVPASAAAATLVGPTVLALSLAGPIVVGPIAIAPRAVAPTRAGSTYVALKGATVHSFEPGEAPSVRTVLIENDRIVEVGVDVAIPEGAQVLDLSGMHLLPGLVDGMVNFDPDHDRLYVGAGVTLVRDVGNDIERMQIEQRRSARERGPGPWLWSAGAVLDGPQPATTYSVVMEDAASAEQKLVALLGLDQKPDYFSFSPGLPKAAWTKTLELAHELHMQVWGPVPAGVTLAEAAAAGQDGFFHLDQLLPAGKNWETVTDEEFAPAIELVVSKRMAITPTLALWGRAVVPPLTKARIEHDLGLLGPFYAQPWHEDLEFRRHTATDEHVAKGLKIVETQGRLVKKLYDRGVELVPGSATPNPWLMPGLALLDELSLWKRAGIPVSACVRAATAGACATLGAELRGTVKKGKYADLIAVKGDPEADLAALYRPAVVVLRGRVLDRKELDAQEEELRAYQAQVRADFTKPLEVTAPELPAGDVILRGHVETRAIGQRISAERFAVVRRFDGALVYCGHVRTPGQASAPDTDTFVRQVIDHGDLVEFEVTLKSGANEQVVKGEMGGGRMSVSRTSDGVPVNNVPILHKLALVDCGSATAYLILGYHRKPGRFQVAFFEGFDPATGPWDLALDSDPSTHLLKMLGGSQVAIVMFNDKGLPVDVRRQSGNGVAQTKLLDFEIVDGRGLPMPADKRARAPAPTSGEKPKDGAEKAKGGVGGVPAEAGSSGPK